MSYTVDEMRNRLPYHLRDYYTTTKLNKVIIDGNEIDGYAEYSYLDEINYVKEPTRSNNGSIENLDSYARFLVPHLILKYKYMDIENYRKVLKLMQSKSEFVVECYDIVKNKRVAHKMYFHPPTMPTLYQRFLQTRGILDYTIELVGTLNNIADVNIVYHLNPPIGTGITDRTEGSVNYALGQEVIIGKDITIKDENFNNEYKFSHWEDENGFKYLDNTAYTINEDLILYAQWQTSQTYTLSYNYGLGEEGDITSKSIVINSEYGTLPTTAPKKVEYDGEQLDGYVFDGWYKTPVKVSNSVAISSADLYNTYANTTIYQLFTPITYTITFNSNGGTSVSTMSKKYGAEIYEPKEPTKNGYTFQGWFLDSTLTRQFSFTTMPPKNITLYAKWG